MSSTCIVRRRTGYTTVDGMQVPAWTDVYSGPVRIAGAERGSSGSRTVTVGDTAVSLATRSAHFPAATTGLRDDDLIDVTGGECAGLALRIVEASWHDQATARRLPVVQVQRPEEWS